MSFLSPALAWIGLAVATIPIIIHLLNRRRFTRVDWAPMKYLKLTIKSNRRRLQMEQLILLALRMLAMLVLFLTLARPMLSDGGFGAWLAGRTKKTKVMVIDDSFSMTELTDTGESIFDRAKLAAAEIIRKTSPADQVTVFVASAPDSPLIRQAQVEEPSDLLSAISRLEPTDMMNRWVETFQKCDDYFEGAAYPIREAIIITDLKTAGWNDEIQKRTATWNDQDQSLTIIDVGLASPPNLAVTDLTQISPVALAGTRIGLQAAISNLSGEDATKLQATLYMDNQSQTIDLPTLKAGSKTVIPIAVDVVEPGQRRIRLELPPDRSHGDNVRFLVLDVRSSIAITIVDGDPRTGGVSSESFFLAAAARAGRAPWFIRVLNDISELDFSNERPDVLVLANVGSLNRSDASKLENAVEEGMGLVVFCGDLMDVSNYNEQLYKNGMGLLPFELADPREDEFTGISVEPWQDSPMQALSQLAPEVLNRVSPSQIMMVKQNDSDNRSPSDANSSARVLAWWNHAERAPALVEKRFKNGRIFLWTVTADRAWCNWQTEPSFVMSARQTLLFAATQNVGLQNVIAGQPLRTEFDVTERPTESSVTIPGSSERQDLTLENSEFESSLQFDQTFVAGFYQMDWQGADIQPQTNRFAVNIDPRESEQDRLTEDRLREIVGDVRMRAIALSNFTDSSANRTELWRTGAVILLVLIGAESMFAAWIGRER